MDTKIIAIAASSLALGIVLTMVVSGFGYDHYDMRHDSNYGRYSEKKDDYGQDHSRHMMDGMMGTSSMSGMMHDMNKALEGKTGTDFDTVFLREMIVHHQGAVEMSKAARERAADPRIKALAETIITAQEKEIADMKAWQVTGTTTTP